MNVTEARARIKARVWQTLAQSELSLKSLPEEELEALVSLVTDAALLEIDEEIGTSLAEGAKETGANVLEGAEGEEVLWQGRPLLSLTTSYLITNERVRVISGLLGKDREDVELVRIQDVDQSQSMRERLLNVGDITVHSHDRSHPTIRLENVKSPQEVHETLRRAVINARKVHGLRYREEM